MEISNQKFYVVSDDSRWYAVNSYAFTDEKKYATKFSEDEANGIIKSITTMNLVKEAA